MSSSSKLKPVRHNWYPSWSPRFWNGMRISDFYSLLRENRFQIHPTRYPMTMMVSGCTVINSFLGVAQQAIYGRKISNVELDSPPIFVIGHWRSGTTLMHELLALDSRLSFPSNFDAFVPHHFLLSRYFLYPIVKLLIPARRPMDNMSLGIASPQEDDFALCSGGAPTPYRRIAFPNRPNRDHMLLDIANAKPQQLADLKSAMQKFVNSLTVRYRSQLVLKSPPHTGRIAKLAEWFPGAKFIHLSRHPYQLVPSTIRLWQTLDKLQAFQIPRYDDAWLKNYIFECQQLMYSAYLQQRSEIPSDQLIEIRFEDLVAQPVEEMGRVYQQLELGDYEQAQPKIEKYFHQKKDHKTNPLELDETLRTEIDSHWRGYMETFGYEPKM
jgi:hypothetical protein